MRSKVDKCYAYCLSSRDGTRIQTFIFLMTTWSQDAIYCISFLHLFPFSKSHRCIYYLHDQKIINEGKKYYRRHTIGR